MKWFLAMLLVAFCVGGNAAETTIDFLFCKESPGTPTEIGRVLWYSPTGLSWSDYEWGMIPSPEGVRLSITTQTLEVSVYDAITISAGTMTFWYVNSTNTPTSLTTTPLVGD